MDFHCMNRASLLVVLGGSLLEGFVASFFVVQYVRTSRVECITQAVQAPDAHALVPPDLNSDFIEIFVQAS